MKNFARIETLSTLWERHREHSRRSVRGGLRLPPIAILVAVMLSFSVPRAAFAQGITGSITGTVTDPSGALVAGATVTARNLATNFMRKVTTSAVGTYTITELLPGQYSVRVDKTAY